MKKLIIIISLLLMSNQPCYSNEMSSSSDIYDGVVTIKNESIFDKNFMFYDNICQKDIGSHFIKSKESIKLTLCMKVLSNENYGDINYSINLGSWVHKAWIKDESELKL